ncbi:MAG: rane protein involved in the export of O-antigen and teichoic acid [Planctomycetota bacterium]|nr:rane protein involved in the export of O-antigen and teichoic acid [Planctomycetota bacterium]
MAVTFTLAARLGRDGYGKVEFAFNIVFWLVLLVRDGLEVIAAREIARHPRLIRPLVDHLLALKGLLALGLLAGLIVVGSVTLKGPTERAILSVYGLMLLTTALGLDYVYRGIERMGLVAVSLVLRTTVYAIGAVLSVGDVSRIVWVPAWLVAGEACGIALVWACYVRRFGMPRPSLSSGQFVKVVVRRGRPVYLIQMAQAVIGSVDFLIVGLMSHWDDVGLYSAPHRMSMAVLTFSLIFQQVVFPGLARSWRESPMSSRASLDVLVRVLMIGLIPIAVGATVLAGPMVRGLLHAEYAGAALLLALGIWRAPLLGLAFLYQTSLIALNRETAGVRLLICGAVASAPLVGLLRWGFGLPGAACAVLIIGSGLVIAGYACLAKEGRQPSWHHHLGKPLLASLAMVPVCLSLRGQMLAVPVLAGALVYIIVLTALGGLRSEDLRVLLGRDDRDAGSK